jgi:hypothetical protein
MEDEQLPAWAEAWQNCFADPYLFAVGVLGFLPYGSIPEPGKDQVVLEKWQEDFLKGFFVGPDGRVTTDARHSVRAGHGVGKTVVLSILAIWWVISRYDSKCVITANSQDQLRDSLWPELTKWCNRLPDALYEQLQIDAERITIKEAPEMAFIVRRTASRSNPEALQGFHAKYLLFLIDEACFDDQTEILTDSGWKFFADLGENDRVLTKPQIGGSAYFEWPSRYYQYPYSGEMITYDTRAMSFSVTPKHKLWRGHRDYVSGHVSWGFQEAGDQLNQRIMFDRTFDWDGEEPLTIEVPQFIGRTTHPRIAISMWDWMEFLGWFLSEGCVVKQKGRPYSVAIAQQDPVARKRIVDCFKRMGFDPKEYLRPNGGSESVQVHSVQLASFLYDGLRAKENRVPRYVMNLSSRLIRIFLDSYLAGDGYVKGKREIFYTSSKGMADDLQELLLRTGVHASITSRDLPHSDFGTHIAKPTGPGYVVGSYVEKYAAVRTQNIVRREYDGFVYCVEVPETHLVYVRRNGKCHWSGNSGIEDIVFEVAQGSLSTAGASAVLMSNPTKTSGFFFDTHHKLRNRWRSWRISSADVPRARGHIEDVIAAYGRDSNRYRVRVEGEFPLADDDTVIPLIWIEQAVSRTVDTLKLYPVWGVDVARFGDDDTALAKRQGNRLLEPIKTRHGHDTMSVTGWIHREYADTHEDMQPKEILIDVIGIGAGVVDRCKELGLPVRGINVGEMASSDDRYMRLRDELWFMGRKWFEDKASSIPDDPRLISELSTVTYDFHSNGRIIVESKKDMKERGARSPDCADAFLLTFAGSSIRKLPARKIRPDKSRSWQAA